MQTYILAGLIVVFVGLVLAVKFYKAKAARREETIEQLELDLKDAHKTPEQRVDDTNAQFDRRVRK